MNNIERTMREERWILSKELFDSKREEPDEVIAFRLIQEDDWMQFIDNIEGNDALKFFNPEQREFSSAKDWEDLAKIEGVEPFDARFEIHPYMAEGARTFCREFRNALRTHGLIGRLPSTRLFFAPWEWRWVLDEETACVLRCPPAVIADIPVSIPDMMGDWPTRPQHIEDDIPVSIPDMMGDWPSRPQHIEDDIYLIGP